MDTGMGWLDFNTFLELALGISLSAAAGFRVFVPLLVLSLAAVFGHFDLPTNLDWAESPQALAVFAAACVLEIGGYYIPWFDTVLDTVATPAAILAGTVVSAALIDPSMAPVAQWTLAFVAGGGTAGLTKMLTNILRVASTAISGGLTNPILATIELGLAIALSVLAITLPLVGLFLAVLVLGIAVQRLWQFLRKLPKPSPEADSGAAVSSVELGSGSKE